MIGTLFVKECRQTMTSLIFLIYIACIGLFFYTQLGNVSFDEAEPPKPGQENYGTKKSTDVNDIMNEGISRLVSEYEQRTYITSPIGFNKRVTLNEEENRKVKEVIESLTGMTVEEIGNVTQEYYKSQGNIRMGAARIEVKQGMTYDAFLKQITPIDKMLGGGSSYGKEALKNNAVTSKTYEDAKKEYEELISKDRLSGGYARLFSDYMGIILGLAPIFLAVARMLRDRRAQMQGLIYSRKAGSYQIIISRYLSLVVMAMLPIVILSFVTLAECIAYGSRAGIGVDYLAFIKYIGGWLLPECMIVTAVGVFFTTLSGNAVAILLQIVWWFISIFAGVAGMHGGDYRMNLISRHNTPLNYEGMINDFNTLLFNRMFYAILAVLLVIATIVVYEIKRKGRMTIHGKISANRKRKSEI